MRERRGECVDEAAGEIVEAGFGVGDAAADAEVEAIEAFEAQREGDEREEEEGDLLGEWKHWAVTARVRSFLPISTTLRLFFEFGRIAGTS